MDTDRDDLDELHKFERRPLYTEVHLANGHTGNQSTSTEGGHHLTHLTMGHVYREVSRILDKEPTAT